MISPVFVLGFLTNLPKFFEARLVNHYYIQILRSGTFYRHQWRNQVSNSENRHEIDLTLKGQLSLFLTGVPHRGGDPSGEDTWSEGSWPGDYFCQTTILIGRD